MGHFVGYAWDILLAIHGTFCWLYMGRFGGYTWDILLAVHGTFCRRCMGPTRVRRMTFRSLEGVIKRHTPDKNHRSPLNDLDYSGKICMV